MKWLSTVSCTIQRTALSVIHIFTFCFFRFADATRPHLYSASMNSTTTTTQRTNRHRANTLELPNLVPTPMLTSNRDLPGPLSMNRLDAFGTVHQLDDANAYLAQYSDTLFGRGTIMTKAVPHSCIACGRSALWVWMGGAFPDVIDIISSSHYRSRVYGRPIKTFDRRISPGQVSTIAGLKITSPARTVCDIMLLNKHAMTDKRRNELACAMLQKYRIDPADCLDILNKNRFWPNIAQARQFLTAIDRCC